MKTKILVCSLIASTAILTCNSYAKDSMYVATEMAASISGPDIEITKDETYDTFTAKMRHELYPVIVGPHNTPVEYYLWDATTGEYALADKPITKKNFEEPKIGARDLLLNSPDDFSIIAEYNNQGQTARIGKPHR